MKKQNENLPEAQSAKKVNNKNSIIILFVAIAGLIGSMGTGMIPDLLQIVAIIVAVIYLVKFFKSRKK